MEVYKFQFIGKRKSQQDAYFVSKDKKMFVVCDGVGGTINGGEASQIVVDSICKKYESNGLVEKQDNLKPYIIKATKELAQSEISDAATTLIMLYVLENQVFISNIGDSRLYYVNPRKKRWWVTKDHSFVQELFDAGILKSEEEMNKHPYRNRITKSLNGNTVYEGKDIQVETIMDIEKGDIFMLCSDGVLENFTNNEIVQILADESVSFKDKCETISLNVESLSSDNSTAILIKI